MPASVKSTGGYTFNGFIAVTLTCVGCSSSWVVALDGDLHLQIICSMVSRLETLVSTLHVIIPSFAAKQSLQILFWVKLG